MVVISHLIIISFASSSHCQKLLLARLSLSCFDTIHASCHGSGANKVLISVHFQPNSNEICRYISKNIDVRREASVNKAIELARTLKGHILIAGSLFLVGEALAIIDNKRQIFEPSDQ